MSNKESYLAARKKIEEARAEAKRAAKDLFKEMATGIFAKHPQLTEFSWCQYTPFFNDGDACTFSANIDYPSINDEGEIYFSKAPAKTHPDRWKYDAHKAVKELLATFNDEDYEAMFGDHVRVKATADNVEVEDYDHE